MLKFLESWLFANRANPRRVWVILNGQPQGAEYALAVVDEVGAVLSSLASKGFVAYPWSAITSLAPIHDYMNPPNVEPPAN